MALQPSGQITLNEIHIEAGGTSGTEAALNDADIRALAGISTGEIGFDDFYGASSSASFVGAVTRKESNEGGIDSSSEAVNLTGAGVQVGDLVVIAVTADVRGYSSMAVQGMSMTQLVNSPSGSNPSAQVWYGFWTASSSNPFFDGSGGGNAGQRMKAMTLVAGIFRNTNTSLLNSAVATAPTMTPNPPSLSAVAGTTLIVITGHVDDDEGAMFAPTGYTRAGTISTDPFTRGGVTGSSTFLGYKITSSSVTEDPGTITGSGIEDANNAVTMRF